MILDTDIGSDIDDTALVVADWLTWDIGESRQLLSWLLHTRTGNRAELERDRFTLIGNNRGNRCLVQMATPWPGRWKEETFFDHPRLRYDWFWNRLLCLVALVPYRSDETPPEIEVQGTAAGCALSVAIDGRRYTVISAAPDGKVAFEGVETDAEFALVRKRGEPVEGHILAAGTCLKADEDMLVDEEAGRSAGPRAGSAPDRDIRRSSTGGDICARRSSSSENHLQFLQDSSPSSFP